MKCKECQFCKVRGRSQSQCYEPGRNHYYCINSEVKESRTRATGFIGFGTNTYESPLQLKTSPRWCPLKNKK